MASSTYAFSSFVKPSAILTTPKSLLTPPSPTNAFIPFTSSNLSISKNALSLSCFSSVPKKSFNCKSQANEHADTERVQELQVYEINEGDRGSPVYLRLSNKSVNSLGDFVLFTNKLYSGDLQKRIGISAGMCILIQHKEKGDRYEATYSLHFGDYGHLSIQGPYLTYDDTYLTVTGGTGIFEGVRGEMKFHNVVFPLKIHYTLYLKGIKDLPQELLGKPVEPHPSVEASPAAKALLPHATIPGFNN